MIRTRWRTWCTAVGAAVLLATGLSRPAVAAPDVPQILTPADGASGVRAGDPLSVRVGDEAADVTFRWRRTDTGAANSAEPFTWVVLPDTQNYVGSGRGAIMGAQTQWIVDHAADLDVALVSHLGDVVNDTTRAQYTQASGYLKTLDDAGIPNTVLPGNHDMNLQTGDASLFQEYFPVSRYAGAGWNSPQVRYGGYYGQDQFGDDPGDRGNLDSFVLLTAGGLDFLVLNLEFNPPDDVIAWADRVLDAYPDRRAMVVTHNLLAPEGGPAKTLERAAGNTAGQLWTKLIAPHCSIFMVVNGHNRGEARRSMRNDCGAGVPVVLSNYQDYPNGGDGYLRYYTFHPADGTVEAYTYSPTLNRFQTDDDSRFDLPVDLSVPPASLETAGTASVSAGEVASVPLPSLVAGARYEWFAEVETASGTTRTATSRFTARDPERRTLAKDTFDRTLVNGWGSTIRGGPWSQLDLTSRFAVSGGAGRLALTTSTQTTALVEGVSSTSTRVDAVVSADKLFDAAYVSVVGRRVGTDEYYARLRLQADGGVRLNLLRGPGPVSIGSTLQVPNLTIVPGQRYQVAVEVTGTSPTTVRGKVWRVGDPEPGWQRSGTDSTASLQQPGGVGVWGYLPSNAASVAPLTLAFDSVVAIDPSVPEEPTEPPANVAPVARFESSSADLTARVDAGGSTDADGTITRYEWDFGDGAAGTGVVATHPYALPGTYQVKLTVTDDDGATHSVTRPVTVTAPPSPGVLAAETFDGTTTAGWGAAEPGGTWSLTGTAARFAVGSGVGTMSVAAGSTLTALLPGVSSSRTRVDAVLSADKLFDAAYVSVVGRRVGTDEYYARLRLQADGGVRLNLLRGPAGPALIGSTLQVPNLTIVPGQRYQVAVEVTGTSPTTVRGKVWRVGDPEPGWQRSGTDSTASLQQPGAVGAWVYLPGSAAAIAPLTVAFDSFTAVQPAP